MKILILCKKFPYPFKDGESIAIHNLAQSLNQNGAKLTLLAMNTTKHYYPVNGQINALDYYEAIHTVRVDNQITASGAFWHWMNNKSYNIGRFYSKAFETKLEQLLAENTFDIVQLETLYLTPYIPCIKRFSAAKIALRSHNVEFEIWKRMASNEKNWLKKYYLQHLARLLKKFEIEQLNEVDLMLSISSKDQKQFQELGFSRRGIVVPIGINLSDYHPQSNEEKPGISLSFIGSLDWMPNIEGLMWFFEKVWRPNRAQLSGLSLYVAGRNSPQWLLEWNDPPQTYILGEVEDAKAFINNHPIMVVPLLSGSGMRAKIIEGMALGRVVITTRLGLEGIPATHLEHVLIADTPDEFTTCFKFCLENRQRVQTIGKKARAFIQSHFDSQEIGRTVMAAYQEVEVW